MQQIDALLTPFVGKIVFFGWAAYSVAAGIVVIAMMPRVSDQYFFTFYGSQPLVCLVHVLLLVWFSASGLCLAYFGVAPHRRTLQLHVTPYTIGLALVIAFTFAAVYGTKMDAIRLWSMQDVRAIMRGSSYSYDYDAEMAQEWLYDWIVEHYPRNATEGRLAYFESRTKEIGDALIGTFVVWLIATPVAYYVVLRDSFRTPGETPDSPGGADSGQPSPAQPYQGMPSPGQPYPGLPPGQPPCAPPPAYGAPPAYAPPPGYGAPPAYAPPPAYGEQPAYGQTQFAPSGGYAAPQEPTPAPPEYGEPPAYTGTSLAVDGGLPQEVAAEGPPPEVPNLPED